MKRAARTLVFPADPYLAVRQWHAAADRIAMLARRYHLTQRHGCTRWTSCENPLCRASFAAIAAGPFGYDAREREPLHPIEEPVDLAALAIEQQEAIVQEWEEDQRRPRFKVTATIGIGSRFL